MRFAALVALTATAAVAQADILNSSSVVSFSQGLMNDGSAVASSRSDAISSLGAPDGYAEGSFVSLGVGGELTVGFAAPITSFIEIREATYNDRALWPEFADVYIGWGSSPSTAQFHHAGLINNFNPVSIVPIEAPEGVTSILYVRIIDRSDLSLLAENNDGFDVESITSVAAVPTPGAAALLGVGGLLVAGRRRR